MCTYKSFPLPHKKFDYLKSSVRHLSYLSFTFVKHIFKIKFVNCRGVVLKKKSVNAIRSGWTPDSRKVTNAHKTYITYITYREVCGHRPTTRLINCHV